MQRYTPTFEENPAHSCYKYKSFYIMLLLMMTIGNLNIMIFIPYIYIFKASLILFDSLLVSLISFKSNVLL